MAHQTRYRSAKIGIFSPTIRYTKVQVTRSPASYPHRGMLTSPRSGSQSDRRVLEVGDPLEIPDAFGDLVGRQPRDTLGPELLDVVGGQRRAVGHRPAQRALVGVAARGEIADEAAGERVAGAGRVDDRLQRIGGHREERVG